MCFSSCVICYNVAVFFLLLYGKHFEQRRTVNELMMIVNRINLITNYYIPTNLLKSAEITASSMLIQTRVQSKIHDILCNGFIIIC